jgi:hypothetical protein
VERVSLLRSLLYGCVHCECIRDLLKRVYFATAVNILSSTLQLGFVRHGRVAPLLPLFFRSSMPLYSCVGFMNIPSRN